MKEKLLLFFVLECGCPFGLKFIEPPKKKPRLSKRNTKSIEEEKRGMLNQAIAKEEEQSKEILKCLSSEEVDIHYPREVTLDDKTYTRKYDRRSKRYLYYCGGHSFPVECTLQIAHCFRSRFTCKKKKRIKKKKEKGNKINK
ncbi:hypothetical protein RFI_25072 [Reticulomyxa filosa]|uniref:Uncharacterized protein n=1 Tax=Reticulomyxa filosa TaxID=46433 RepID=X6MFU6_RETFI|nr:hypothetical protein RFI_25072 [Reticulomyxa filosa]|eukprot:ETO12302.1 hypothetical protein RFI_25072 [Reticulomyxa filosa]